MLPPRVTDARVLQEDEMNIHTRSRDALKLMLIPGIKGSWLVRDLTLQPTTAVGVNAPKNCGRARAQS